MKKHPAEVAALADVVRSVLAELEERGRAPREKARAVLALVDRWLAGEVVTAEALEEAAVVAHEDKLPFAEREKDRALQWANCAAGNLAYVARKGKSTNDGGRGTMDAAEYALSSLRVEGVRDRAALEALRAAAYERAVRSTTRAPAPPKTTRPKPVRLKDELASSIGDVANAWLLRCKAAVEPARRADDAALRAFLNARQYPDHPAVLDFDRRYGGIVAPDGPGEADTDWLYGAYACLASEAHAAPRGAPGREGDDALVPVIYSPNDVIYFLDGHGAAWCEDTIEGGLARFAADADRMVARVQLYQVLFARSDKGCVLELDGARGAEAAALLAVEVIPQATDDLARVWGDGRALVFEERGPEGWKTRVGVEQKKALAPIRAKLLRN